MVSEGVRSAVLVLFVAGCGAGPALQPPPPRPSIAHHAGGAVLGACASDDTVAIAGAASVALWRFSTAAPELIADVALGPVLGPPVDHLECADGISVGRADQRWRVNPKTGELVPTGAGVARLAPLPVELPIDAARRVAVEPARFGVTGPGGDLFWRPVSGPLQAAAWDGEVLWAVGINGLWRWRPGPGRPMAVPLPDGWADRALTGVFRDAQYLWIRDAAGVGVPLDVRSAVAKSVGEAGPLPVAQRDRRVAVAGRLVEGRIGENQVQLDREDTRNLDAPLEAICEFRDGVLLASGGQLRFWGGDDLAEVWRSPLPGPTVALIGLADGRVMAVGRRYGFLALDFQQALGGR